MIIKNIGRNDCTSVKPSAVLARIRVERLTDRSEIMESHGVRNTTAGMKQLDELSSVRADTSIPHKVCACWCRRLPELR